MVNGQDSYSDDKLAYFSLSPDILSNGKHPLGNIGFVGAIFCFFVVLILSINTYFL